MSNRWDSTPWLLLLRNRLVKAWLSQNRIRLLLLFDTAGQLSLCRGNVLPLGGLVASLLLSLRWYNIRCQLLNWSPHWSLLDGFDLHCGRTWLMHIICVVIDFKGWLLYFFNLHVKLVRQLLQLPARLWCHQWRLNGSTTLRSISICEWDRISEQVRIIVVTMSVVRDNLEGLAVGIHSTATTSSSSRSIRSHCES